MKKSIIFLVGAMMLLAGPSAFSQIRNDDGRWSFGGGFTSFGLSGSDAKEVKNLGFPNMIPGFYFGISVDYPFSVIEGLTLEPGANITHYGNTFRFGQGKDDKSYHANYINVPINIKYTFGDFDSGSGIAIFTGPRFNFGMGGNIFSTGKTYPGVKPLDAEWGVGLAVTMADAFVIRGGYDFGLSKCLKDNKDLGFDDEIVYRKALNIGISFIFK